MKRDELTALADEMKSARSKVDNWPENRCGGLPEGDLGRVFMDFLQVRNLSEKAEQALRTLASRQAEPYGYVAHYCGQRLYFDGANIDTVNYYASLCDVVPVYTASLTIDGGAGGIGVVTTPIADAAFGKTYTIDHDGFVGTVQGSYVTREGKRGVVLQQVGTRVVHVYGEKWLKDAPSSSATR